MRLAVYHNLPSGGGKRALQEMTKRLCKEATVDVFTLSTAEHEFCDLRPYCRRHIVVDFYPWGLVKSPFGRLNQGVRTANLLRLQRQQAELAHRIDSEGYDVVFVHNCRFGQSPALLRYLRTPSVYYCGEPPRTIYEPPANRPYLRYSPAQQAGNRVDPLPRVYRDTLKRMDQGNVKAATSVLVNSHFSLESLYRTYGLYAQVGRLGVDCRSFRPTGAAKQDFVLSVGSITPMKGFDFLIESLALLPESVRLPLVLAANSVEPREEKYLVELARQRNVQLQIRPGISDEELVDLYNRARLTLYTPVMEPFGFVPLESMACGTAVLGVAEAGVRESVVHRQTGWLVERNQAAMAQALAILLAQPALVECLGETGRRYVVSTWTWDQSIARLLDRIAAVAHRV